MQRRWRARLSPIDRHMTAAALGFDRPTANSLDSVSDRDFALEYLSAASICAMHLSRFAEELVIWSSAQFRFVRMSDRFSTGSSIMPQKRNPDAAELLRAKLGRIMGATVALFTIMKGLPLTYSKDMQEDKEQVFDAADTLALGLAAMEGMVSDLTANRTALEAAAASGFFHRDRSGRLAGARIEPAVPRCASCHRQVWLNLPKTRAATCLTCHLRKCRKCMAKSRMRSILCWVFTIQSPAAPAMAAQHPIMCARRSPAGKRFWDEIRRFGLCAESLAACGADGLPSAPEQPKTGLNVSGEINIGVQTEL